jgi:uncharacterized protein YdaU (DUF1376 family)
MADKKPDIWMPLYVADYQADTAYLTTEQHGAYLLMLMAYWRNGPIPDNDGIIAAITRQSPDAWRSTRAVLEAFFDVSGGTWVHKRVEKEYDRAKRNRQTAHERAVKAARARWGGNGMLEALPGALPEDMLVQCPSPSPSSSQSKASPAREERPSVADATTTHSVAAKPKKAKATETTLQDWLTALDGKRAIAADDPLLTELTDAGVPDDFQRLAWLVFKRDWLTRKAKDWPATFRNAVRRGWIRLWYFDTTTGECRLNQTGELARRTLMAE